MEVKMTVEEIEILIDGLNAYVNEVSIKGLMGSLVGGLLIGDSEEAKQNYLKAVEEKEQKTQRKIRELEESTIMLKSKLIQMKNAIAAKESVNW